MKIIQGAWKCGGKITRSPWVKKSIAVTPTLRYFYHAKSTQEEKESAGINERAPHNLEGMVHEYGGYVSESRGLECRQVLSYST